MNGLTILQMNVLSDQRLDLSTGEVPYIRKPLCMDAVPNYGEQVSQGCRGHGHDEFGKVNPRQSNIGV